MTDFNQIKSIWKVRSCSTQPVECYVPPILKSCKIYLSKSVNILLGQPVLFRNLKWFTWELTMCYIEFLKLVSDIQRMRYPHNSTVPQDFLILQNTITWLCKNILLFVTGITSQPANNNILCSMSSHLMNFKQSCYMQTSKLPCHQA